MWLQGFWVHGVFAEVDDSWLLNRLLCFDHVLMKPHIRHVDSLSGSELRAKMHPTATSRNRCILYALTLVMSLTSCS